LSSILGIKDKLFYGWVVVIACLIIATVVFGISYSFGVFLKSLGGEFGLTRGATSAVFSVYMLLYSVFGILGGWALDRYGPRIIVLFMGLFTGLSLLLTSQANSSWQLFISYGLLLAIGVGPAYIVVMSTALRWFDKKRGLALGIVGSGTGLGTLLVAPFATYLISNFGWRMAYIIIGSIAWLVVIPLSRLLKKNPAEIGALPDGAKPDSGEMGIDEPSREGNTRSTEFSLLQASRTSNFWLLGAIWLLYAFCYLMLVTHLVPHATDIGIRAMEAAGILSLMGGSNIAGRLLMGRVSDSIGRKTTAIICALLVTGAMILLTRSQDLWMLCLFGVVCGFSFGGLDPAITALIGDIFGLRSIGIIMGTLNVAWGIGSAIGPAAGGFIFDVSESYFVAFLAGALAMLIVALLVPLTRRETKRNVR
jgi:MFS family permease